MSENLKSKNQIELHKLMEKNIECKRCFKVPNASSHDSEENV